MGWQAAATPAQASGVREPGAATVSGASGTSSTCSPAAPVNRRPLLLRLRDSGGQLVTTVTGADLRTLGPGTSRSFGFALTVPSTLAVGRYQLWAAAPDVDARLAGNPAYAIRFANAARSVGGLRQAWNGKTGEFSLGLALDVR